MTTAPARPGPAGPILPILSRLLVIMRPHAALLLGAGFAILVTTAIELIPPLAIRYAIDHLMPAGQMTHLVLLALGLLGLAVVQGLFDYTRLYTASVVAQRIVFELRNEVFQHLSRLSFSFYDRARTGDLMSRVTADIGVLTDFFGRAAIMLLSNLLLLSGILAVLLIWDWRLALIYLTLFPLLGHAVYVYARRVRPAMSQVQRNQASLTAALQQSLAGFPEMKLFGRESFEEARIDRYAAELRDANIETTRITSFWMPYIQVLAALGTALVLWLGGLGVIEESLTLGTLIGFATYIAMLVRPIRQSGMVLNIALYALVAAERVFEVLDIPPEIEDAPDAVSLPPGPGHLRIEGVEFSYDGQHQVLRDITLEARPGELVALVGASGAGKTTLVHLLPRFYDPQRGRISVDSHDIHRVTVKSLRDAIGIALQSVFLFDTSIGENIAYGRPGVTEAEIEQVARAVQMHDYITTLPMGYATPVGERGFRLSGGQRQRIALARVLLRDPRVLILDEPTSAVDAETERQLQQAIAVARKGRTTFVIAHRLWTVQQADQIIVLDHGRIVEQARTAAGRSAHQALIEAGGRYSKLVKMQRQDGGRS